MKLKRAIVVTLVLGAALAIHYAHAVGGDGKLTFGLIQDITGIYGFYPWDTFSLRELRAGLFPLWNPHNALGEPHIANMQTALFYPLTWLRFLFGMDPLALDLLLLLRLFIAGVSTYIFMRRLTDCGVATSLVGALSFMLTGYFTRHVYMSHLNVEILVPLAMLCFGELARRGGFGWFLASAGTVWLCVVGGFPESTFYVMLAAGLFFITVAPVKKWVVAAGAVLAGSVASSVQLLPFLEYVSQSWFYHPSGVGSMHLDIGYFFTLWSPWFFGTNELSPVAPFLMPYLGLAPIALAFGSLGGLKKKRRLFFALLATVSLGLIYGVPPFSLLSYLPVFDLTFNYKYAVPVAAFCVAVLAGEGARDLLEGTGGRIVAVAAFAMAAVVAVAAAVDACGGFAPFEMRCDISCYAGVFGVAAVLLLMGLSANGGHRIETAVLLVALASYLPVGGNVSKYDDAPLNAVNSSEMNYLKGLAVTGRFNASGNILFPDLNLIAGIDDLRYYNPMYSNSYAKFIADANGLKTDAALRGNFVENSMLVPEQSSMTGGWLDSAAVKAWIGEGPPGTVDLMPEMFAEADWIAEKNGMVVEENILVGGFERPAILAHAPSALNLKVRVGNNSSLRFRPLIHPGAVGCSDGARFTIRVKGDSKVATVFSVFIASVMESGTEYTLPLEAYEGENIHISFIATPGPAGDVNCDWTGWAALSVGDMEPDGWKRISAVSDRTWERVGDTPWVRTEGGCDAGAVGFHRLTSQSVKLVSYRENADTVSATAYYPGWRAYNEDGLGERRIRKYGEVFQSIKNAGNFILVYKPASFRIGLWATLVSLLAWLLGVCGIVAARYKREG